MAERTVVLRNPSGLHARPAERFTREASAFRSEITVAKAGDDSAVDAKSVLSVLTLDCLEGDEILIRAEGPDAEEALARLVEAVEGGLGEAAVT